MSKQQALNFNTMRLEYKQLEPSLKHLTENACKRQPETSFLGDSDEPVAQIPNLSDECHSRNFTASLESYWATLIYVAGRIMFFPKCILYCGCLYAQTNNNFRRQCPTRQLSGLKPTPSIVQRTATKRADHVYAYVYWTSRDRRM